MYRVIIAFLATVSLFGCASVGKYLVPSVSMSDDEIMYTGPAVALGDVYLAPVTANSRYGKGRSLRRYPPIWFTGDRIQGVKRDGVVKFRLQSSDIEEVRCFAIVNSKDEILRLSASDNRFASFLDPKPMRKKLVDAATIDRKRRNLKDIEEQISKYRTAQTTGAPKQCFRQTPRIPNRPSYYLSVTQAEKKAGEIASACAMDRIGCDFAASAFTSATDLPSWLDLPASYACGTYLSNNRCPKDDFTIFADIASYFLSSCNSDDSIVTCGLKKLTVYGTRFLVEKEQIRDALRQRSQAWDQNVDTIKRKADAQYNDCLQSVRDFEKNVRQIPYFEDQAKKLRQDIIEQSRLNALSYSFKHGLSDMMCDL